MKPAVHPAPSAMQHLFDPQGQAALVSTLQSRPLLAFDFDGTLAPIVAHPDDARLSAGVTASLSVLASRLPVAIITGRSVDDVRGRLGFEPQYIVGNHGAEDGGGTPANAAPIEALQSIRARLLDALPRLKAAGVTLEDKGHSLALHYRQSRARRRALQVIEAVLHDRDDSLRVFGGKLVVNVVSTHAPDKADAMRALVLRSGAPCAIFAGDDVNDEPVFAQAPPQWLTIRVGRGAPGCRARYFVNGTHEMAQALERMVSLLGAR